MKIFLRNLERKYTNSTDQQFIWQIRVVGSRQIETRRNNFNLCLLSQQMKPLMPKQPDDLSFFRETGLLSERV